MTLSFLAKHCSNLKVCHLKQLACIIGSKQATTRTTRITNILKQAAILENVRKKWVKNNNISILAIDTGISNFSYALFKMPYGDGINLSSNSSTEPILVDWNKFQLERKFGLEEDWTMSLAPEDTYMIASKVTEFLMNMPSFPANLYAIERQRTRTMSSSKILEPVLKSNIIEHILFSNLRQLNANKEASYSVLSSDPQRMVQFWCGSTRKRQTAKESKIVRINLVKDIISKSLGVNNGTTIRIGIPTIQVSGKLKDLLCANIKDFDKFSLYKSLGFTSQINGVNKDDDLADSFLHSLAWLQWLYNYRHIHELLLCDKAVETSKLVEIIQPLSSDIY